MVQKFISKSIEIHSNKYDYSKVVYKNIDTKEMRKHIEDFKHFQINEIFKSEQIYDVTLDEYKEYDNSKSYRYSFLNGSIKKILMKNMVI